MTEGGWNKSFQFDQVFAAPRSQQDVYEGLGISKLISRIIDVSVWKAYNLKTGLPRDYLFLWTDGLRQDVHDGGRGVAGWRPGHNLEGRYGALPAD